MKTLAIVVAAAFFVAVQARPSNLLSNVGSPGGKVVNNNVNSGPVPAGGAVFAEPATAVVAAAPATAVVAAAPATAVVAAAPATAVVASPSRVVLADTAVSVPVSDVSAAVVGVSSNPPASSSANLSTGSSIGSLMITTK